MISRGGGMGSYKTEKIERKLRKDYKKRNCKLKNLSVFFYFFISGRVAGKGGRTKYTIENVTKTRWVFSCVLSLSQMTYIIFVEVAVSHFKTVLIIKMSIFEITWEFRHKNFKHFAGNKFFFFDEATQDFLDRPCIF